MVEDFRKVINKMRAGFMSDSCKFFFLRQLKKNVRRPKPEALRIKKALGLEPLPSRSVQVVASSAGGGASPSYMIAAGGNFFSQVGGVYSSVDGGQTWRLDIDLGQEVKACRSLALPTINATRVFCVSAGQSGGSIVSADVPM